MQNFTTASLPKCRKNVCNCLGIQLLINSVTNYLWLDVLVVVLAGQRNSNVFSACQSNGNSGQK